MSIDRRLMERRRTVAEDNAKRSMSRLLKLLLFLVVVGAVVWLVFSPWLSVSKVTSSGIVASDSHAVLVDHGVSAGTPMILVSVSEVEGALLEDPWVAEATVRRHWPDEVTVAVTERVPVAWVRTDGGWTRRAIDGVALPSKSEPDDGMARIDLPGISDAEATEDVDLLGALAFAAALPPDLFRDTVLARRDGEMWASVFGYEVRLGRSVDMAEKALSLDALLEENLPETATLVLIAPTNPAVVTPSGEEGADEEGVDNDTEGTGADDDTGSSDSNGDS